MKIILLFLVSAVAMAQAPHANIPALSVTVPAQTLPALKTAAQQITIVTPRNGGQVTFTVPAQTLAVQTVPAQTVSTTATTAPVALGTITLNFSCSGPDLQHLSCTAAQQ